MEYIGVVFYLLVLLGLGALAARRMRNVRDYFAAGKRLGFLTVAFSARATGESAWLLLGLTGMGAAIGVKAFWVVLGETLGVGIAWLLMSRRFKRLTDRYDAITIPDYLEARFRDDAQLIRRVAAGALVIFVTIYVSAQIDATGAAFESFLGVDYYLGIAIGFAVVMAYSVSGGFLAVAWSDVFQGTLMFAGLVVLPIVGLIEVGGVGALVDGLAATDPNLLSWSGTDGWPLEAVFSVLGLSLIGLGFLGSPQIFVRFLALRDEREISAGAGVAIIWTLVADGGAVLTGMVGRHLLTSPGQDVAQALGNGAQDVLPMLVSATMPPLLVGLYIAIVLSAIMSTVDSLLLVAGSAAVRDWYQKVRRPDMPDDALVGHSRAATLILALIGLTIAVTVSWVSPSRTVFWFVIFGWSGIAATFCPTIILSLFWRGMTGRGAVAAMVAGFVSVPLFKFGVAALPEIGPLIAELSELPPAFAVSMLTGWLVSVTDRRGVVDAPGIDLELRDAAARRD